MFSLVLVLVAAVVWLGLTDITAGSKASMVIYSSFMGEERRVLSGVPWREGRTIGIDAAFLWTEERGEHG